jgi:hypothetical protein
MDYLGSFNKSFQPGPSGSPVHPLLPSIRRPACRADGPTLSHGDHKVAAFIYVHARTHFPAGPRRST